MTSGTYQGQGREQQGQREQPVDRQQIIKDMAIGAGGAFGVILFLALVVVVGINYIPYYLASSWLISRVPGLVPFLKASSFIVFPIAVGGLAFSMFHFVRGVVSAIARSGIPQHRRLQKLPVILAFAVVVVCVVSNADVIAIFVSMIGSVVGSMVTLAQFRWILFQHSAESIRRSIQQEKRTEDLQDPDYSPAARSTRMALKQSANIAMIIDVLVSLFVYPPIALSMLMVLAATQNFGLIDWGNVVMVVITTVVPGIIFKLWLNQITTAEDIPQGGR